MVQLVDNMVERVFPRLRSKPQFAYPIGLAIFIAAVLVRVVLSGWLPPALAFPTFFPAVLFAALVAGSGPALLVIAASVAFSWYYLLPGSHHGTGDASAIGSVLVFVVLSLPMVAVVHLLNRKVESLIFERERNESLLHDSALGEVQLEQLNTELRHRLKNTFAVIAGLVSQSARYSPDVPTFAKSIAGRLSAMGTAIDLVATRNFIGASLNELVADTLQPLVPPGTLRVSMKGDDLIIPGDVANALALTLHELGTNAIKHGAWSNARGSVDVRWRVEKMDDDEAKFELVWDERGGPPVATPERRGLGSILIDSGFSIAQVERTFNEKGVLCRIEAVVKVTTTRRTRGRASARVS